MTDIASKIEGISLVLLGSFNPKIFHPIWFAAENMVSRQEAEAAEIGVIHPEVATFTMNKIKYEITRDRFVLNTTFSPLYNVLRDIALGAFTLLHHTPITALGLNYEVHYLLNSEETWHQFGHRIAPKECWNGVLGKPGLRKLLMEGVREDKYKGFIRVEAAPSVRIHPGVFLSVNDHFAFESESAGAAETVQILKQGWSQFLEQSKERCETLLKTNEVSK
jgi:hypothetical protein